MGTACVAPRVNFRQNGLDATPGKCDPVCADGDDDLAACDSFPLTP
jgi:hypothetical protein